VRAPTRTERDAARLGLSLFPLRLFLGLTFVYGGIQKFSDPGFFHPGAPTYIGTQLRGFANGTPGGFLLRAFAIPHPSLAGAGVALTEIAVGLLVTTGLLTRPAAAVGLLLNLVLFLTNSWHTYPYFLGSDIVFVFAWSPFVLVGATGQPSLDPALERIARRHPNDPHRQSEQPAPAPDAALTRRRAIGTVLGAVGGATAAIAGVSLLLRGSYRPARTLSASAAPHGHTPTATTSGAATTSSASTTTGASSTAARPAATGLPRGAVKLGAATQLPVGQGATYSDPGDGQPDIVVRLSDGRLVAHSAVCTHAGCTVAYQGGQIVCPCHGSRFNAQTGAVINGPAVTPLAPRKVIQHAGEIYALPA
jgi:thiosulfate dehydrogenase [quinone] large subunit